MQLLDILADVRNKLMENARIEALPHMRLASVTEMVAALDAALDWARPQSATFKVVEKHIRDVCFAILQVLGC